MRILIQDLRFAIRMILKNPIFTVVAVGTLAIGIGANTAFFSLLDGVFLRPLPVERPEELVLVKAKSGEGLSSDFAYPDYAAFRDQSRSFHGLAAFNALPLTLTVREASERIFAQGASGNLFQVMGKSAQLGRTLAPLDDRVGAEGVVVLSDRLWRSRFGGDRGIVGRAVRLEGRPFTVIGVAPRHFEGINRGFAPDLWIPITQTAPFEFSPDALTARNMHWLRIIGRIQSGVSREAAQSELAAIAGRLDETQPLPGGAHLNPVLAPGSRGETSGLEDVSRVSVLLMGVVVILLLIACANVGGLLLSRASVRRREIAIRQALGAGRLRLIRQLLTESLLLAVLGGASGMFLALWSMDLLSLFTPESYFPIDLGMRLDARVFVFSAAVSLATALLFGLAPSLQASRSQLSETLKTEAGARLSGRTRRGWGATMVILQVAMALVLLLGGGLFLRSLRKEQEVDLGFNPRHALALTVQPAKGSTDETRVREFFRQLVERTRSLPGVTDAALVTTLHPSPGGSRLSLDAADLGLPGKEVVDIDLTWVGPGALKTLGIPVLRGREFGDEDVRTRGPLDPIIVNESLARLLWPGQDPIGRRFSLSGPGKPASLEVVGLAKNGKYRSLRETPRHYMYRCLRDFGPSERTLVVRTVGDPDAMIPAVKSLTRSIDPNFPVYGLKTLEEHVAVMLSAARLTTWLVGLFSMVALGLAGLGLYGLISYSVLQRTREIGVRMALGARRGDVLRMVVGNGMKLIVMGIALGVGGAFSLTRFISSFLFDVKPTDPVTFAAVLMVLGGVALLACYVPARRASKVDPMNALRYE